MKQIQRALDVLQRDNPRIELRPIMRDGRWWHGVYDDHGKLAETVKALNGLEAEAVFWTFNRLSPTVAVTNKLAPCSKGSGGVHNRDVDRVRFIFLDYDAKPCREAARELATKVQTHLAARGWGRPILVSSGGGFYHFYPCDLAPSEARAFKPLVQSLNQVCRTPGAVIDAKCVNVARIARVPGTYHRKDDPVLARILEVAE
jgi:hypothetical protein